MDEDKFKVSFKYYKLKNPKPSLKDVLTADSNKVTPINLNECSQCSSLLGLKSAKWDAYTFEKHPGLILIRNPFTAAGQRYWIRRCLEYYPRKPNNTNIDYEMELQDWWSECHRDGNSNMGLLKKLRWTTLGYHHNWDTKKYTEENQSPFPEDLAELSAMVAKHIGVNTFKAEAAIVNYYHMDSTLAPHTDHSECNLEAPLFSFSFGQSAIFLIGGRDKSTEPSAILLQSGDIVVMSREARLCYHAVPKILPAKDKPWIEDLQLTCDSNNSAEILNIELHNQVKCDNKQFTNYTDREMKEKDVINVKLLQNVFSDPSQVKDTHECSSNIEKLHLQSKCLKSDQDGKKIKKDEIEKEWHVFARYAEVSRININVRQVLNDKQKCLPDL